MRIIYISCLLVSILFCYSFDNSDSTTSKLKVNEVPQFLHEYDVACQINGGDIKFMDRKKAFLMSGTSLFQGHKSFLRVKGKVADVSFKESDSLVFYFRHTLSQGQPINSIRANIAKFNEILIGRRAHSIELTNKAIEFKNYKIELVEGTTNIYKLTPSQKFKKGNYCFCFIGKNYAQTGFGMSARGAHKFVYDFDIRE